MVIVLREIIRIILCVPIKIFIGVYVVCLEDKVDLQEETGAVMSDQENVAREDENFDIVENFLVVLNGVDELSLNLIFLDPCEEERDEEGKLAVLRL